MSEQKNPAEAAAERITCIFYPQKPETDYDERLVAMRTMRDSIAAIIAEKYAERELEHLEEIGRWKEASGLIKGGDPEPITPDDLERNIHKYDYAEIATAELVEAAEEMLELIRQLDEDDDLISVEKQTVRWKQAIDAVKKEQSK